MARVTAPVLFRCIIAVGTAAVLAGAARASSFTQIYQFTGGADGGQLIGGVVMDASGTLYGETSNGGDLKCTIKGLGPFGCGTVFSYSVAKGLTVLATFTGANGKFGDSTPTLVGSTLYGSTAYGGPTNEGSIFSLNTDGSDFKILHQFHGTDGIGPVEGPMIAGPGNLLYGITVHGGAYGNGVLFALQPTGAYRILHSFTGGSDGLAPFSLLLASDDTLVGSTGVGGVVTADCNYGAGVIFTYVPRTQQFSMIAALACGTTGPNAYLGSVGPGDLAYAVDAGGFFSVNAHTGLVSIIPAVNPGFQAVGGGAFSGPVLMPDGSLVGTFSQGPYSADGALYQVANGQIIDLVDFGSGIGGAFPHAEPLLTPSGALFGTSASSACTNCGVIWQYTP